jgi:hypothetical protein
MSTAIAIGFARKSTRVWFHDSRAVMSPVSQGCNIYYLRERSLQRRLLNNDALLDLCILYHNDSIFKNKKGWCILK